MRVTIIGTGLIGGSMAIALKEKGFAQKIIGVDDNKIHEQKALTIGLVDEVMDINEAIENADVIILSVPVDVCVKIISNVLDKVKKQVVFDTGSTKRNVLAEVEGHENRNRFVASHTCTLFFSIQHCATFTIAS